MSTANQKKCTASAPAPKRRLTETPASPANAVTPPDAKSTQQLGTLFFQSNGAQSKPRDAMLTFAEQNSHSFAIQWQRPRSKGQLLRGPTPGIEQVEFYRTFGSFSTASEFFKQYKGIPAALRCCYEYIKQEPVKLYCDVEWETPLPENTSALVALNNHNDVWQRVHCLQRAIASEWNRSNSETQWNDLSGRWIILDASREKKKSKTWKSSFHMVHTGIEFSSATMQKNGGSE